MDILTKFLIEEAFVMIIVLFIIAEMIKKTEKVDSRWIPLLLLAISLGFTPLLLGSYTAANIVQAILVAGAEQLGYQVYDKTFKED